MIFIKKTSALLLTAMSLFVFSQISLGMKSHLLFQTGQPTWTNIKNNTNTIITNNGKNSTGFNIGLFARMSTPLGVFIQPELYYTSLHNQFTVSENSTSTTIEAKNNRIDLPILVGYNLLGKLFGIYAGPVASYNLSTKNQWNNFKENATRQFTVGYQLGAQAQISKLVFSARYEGAVGDKSRSFINATANQEVRYDNRPSLLLLGLGYQF